MKNLPIEGKYYNFFENGLVSPSTHFICRVERIIPIEESQATLFLEYCDLETGECYRDKLWNIWVDNKDLYPNIFSESTDCFIECSCPKFEEELLYLARTINGGWFSMNIQNKYQLGELDITGELSKTLEEHKPNIYIE